MALKIGADPELFVKKDGQFVSAYNMIKGTKENPMPVKDGAVQVDGMALEINIDPATSLRKFRENINSVLGTLRDMVPKDCDLVICPVADFGEDYIKQQPKEAADLGCMPDMNAYTMDVNEPPDVQIPFRTAAGHIHLGWTEVKDPWDDDHLEKCMLLTKWLDLYAGIESIVRDKDPDSHRRRQLYGAPGSFRPKTYGMEYRVLSNYWLGNDRETEIVYRRVLQAFQKFEKQTDLEKFLKSLLINCQKYYSNKLSADDVDPVRIIKESDSKIASMIMSLLPR